MTVSLVTKFRLASKPSDKEIAKGNIICNNTKKMTTNIFLTARGKIRKNWFNKQGQIDYSNITYKYPTNQINIET